MPSKHGPLQPAQPHRTPCSASSSSTPREGAIIAPDEFVPWAQAVKADRVGEIDAAPPQIVRRGRVSIAAEASTVEVAEHTTMKATSAHATDKTWISRHRDEGDSCVIFGGSGHHHCGMQHRKAPPPLPCPNICYKGADGGRHE